MSALDNFLKKLVPKTPRSVHREPGYPLPDPEIDFVLLRETFTKSKVLETPLNGFPHIYIYIERDVYIYIYIYKQKNPW